MHRPLPPSVLSMEVSPNAGDGCHAINGLWMEGAVYVRPHE